MSDFFRRNLVWITILLCVTGVTLSIIGIPTNNLIFFFVGIILSLPTIAYLIFHVFFYHEKPELNLAPTSSKFSTSNITSIVTDKESILLHDEITDEDDLEPFYNGYANEAEITKRLHEVTNNERERAIDDLSPEEQNNFHDDTTVIENTTNDELYRQRELATNNFNTFSTEIPPEIEIELNQDITEDSTDFFAVNPSEEPAEVQPTTKSLNAIVESATKTIDTPIFENDYITEPITESIEPQEQTIGNNITSNEPVSETDYTAPTLDAPNFVLPSEPVMPQTTNTSEKQKLTQVDLTNTTVIRVNAENLALRKQKAQEKKNILSQLNLEKYLQRYFIETAACFLMDRTIYKDKNGIAPYNKFAVNKETNLPEYTISNTKGRLYKFCTYLIDAERFIKHPSLYNDFVTAIEKGISLSRISETLHPLYRKKYRKDFILNLSNREDWDNVIIIVYNNYILNNDNFKNIFTHVPFEIPFAYNDENIIDYLKDTDLQERFAEKYPALEEMGVPTFWDALYICFINSVKQKLTIEQIENAILREHKKIARSLKRIDNTRHKLKKAS